MRCARLPSEEPCARGCAREAKSKLAQQSPQRAAARCSIPISSPRPLGDAPVVGAAPADPCCRRPPTPPAVNRSPHFVRPQMRIGLEHHTRPLRDDLFALPALLARESEEVQVGGGVPRAVVRVEDEELRGCRGRLGDGPEERGVLRVIEDLKGEGTVSVLPRLPPRGLGSAAAGTH